MEAKVAFDIDVFVDEIEVKEELEDMHFSLYFTPNWALEPLTV